MDHAVGLPAVERIQNIESVAAAHRERILPIPVEITHEDLITGATVGEFHIGSPAVNAVLHVNLIAAAHRERIHAVAVPVTDEHFIARTAVGEHTGGLA